MEQVEKSPPSCSERKRDPRRVARLAVTLRAWDLLDGGHGQLDAVCSKEKQGVFNAGRGRPRGLGRCSQRLSVLSLSEIDHVLYCAEKIGRASCRERV